MSTISSYCKAYLLSDFQKFSQWKSNAKDSWRGLAKNGAKATDFLFLHANYIITDGIYLDEDIVFDNVTDEWKSFCQEKLGFEVPEYADSAIKSETILDAKVTVITEADNDVLSEKEELSPDSKSGKEKGRTNQNTEVKSQGSKKAAKTPNKNKSSRKPKTSRSKSRPDT